MKVQTLVDLLRERASDEGDRRAYTFLENGLREAESLSYRELDRQARAIAARLQELGAAGERALLLYPPGLSCLAGFFGCLYAGVVAIPAPAPEASRAKRTWPRLRAIAADARATWALTLSGVQAQAEQGSETPIFEPASMRWLATDQVEPAWAEHWQAPRIGAETLAYLQYTSGSTATPRGVMIRHRDLVYHAAYLQATCGYTPESVSVTWMPYFHDYGLVEGLLEPLYNATPCHVMSPLAFVKRPSAWLQAISRHRATHSQGPNFAYEHCLRRITAEQRAELDLSRWEAAGIAAEPINPRVMLAFFEAFRGCGFRWASFCPAYGLAEATLMVSFSRQSEEPVLRRFRTSALEHHRIEAADDDAPPASSRTVVGCGRLFGATRVAIVDPETRTRCGPDEVGEIWVADPAVAAGYWQRPDETAQTFQARLADTGEGPFLRTGDLGFFQDGQLFVSGRLKDLIIIRGTNHHPQDIEWTVQALHPALRSGNGAAFSVIVEGQERLVIAQEVERAGVPGLDADAVMQAIRQAVAEAHELDLLAVLLLERGSLLKTASGKVQRQACRAAFLDGTLNMVARWMAPGAIPTPFADEPSRSTPGKSSATPIQAGTNGQDTQAPPRPAERAEISRKRADDLIGWLRDYAEQRINSRLMDERRGIPPHIILDFGNRGLLGMQVAEEDGGLGLGYRDLLRVLEQLAAIDLNLATVVFLNNTNGLRPIQHFATPEVRAELLPLLARGRELASFALSEPGAGSNLGAVASLARPDPAGGWRLHGLKRWNASAWAGVVSVFVRQVEAHGRVGGLTGFALRQGTPGLRIGPEALTMGLRGSVQNTLYLQDVPVRPADLLGAPGQGMRVVDDALMAGRLGTAGVCLGALKRCAQLMHRYTSRRLVATGRLLEHPVTLVTLSDLVAQISAVQALVGQLAERLDAGEALPAEWPMAAKCLATEFLNGAAGELVQLLGGRGYMENNIAPQLFRDARALSIGEGPNATLTMFLGRSLRQTGAIAGELAHRWGAVELGRRLADAARAIEARCLAPGSPFPESSTALSWADTLSGRLAIEAILLAAAQTEHDRQPTRTARLALDWVRLRFEAMLQRTTLGTPAESLILQPLQTSEVVHGYIESIGDVEQALAGEEEALDPLLRRAPAVSAPAIEDLPGALGLRNAPARPDDPAARPTAEPLARLPAATKREMLERLLRSRGGPPLTTSP